MKTLIFFILLIAGSCIFIGSLIWDFYISPVHSGLPTMAGFILIAIGLFGVLSSRKKA